MLHFHHTIAHIITRKPRWFLRSSWLFFAWCLGSLHASAQPFEKKKNHQTQFWWSVNSTIKLSERWGMIADFHIRRNDFLQDPSFYFIRGGAQYTILPKLTVVAGYAHMWLATQVPQPKDFVFANENRIYQQIQYVQSIGKKNPVTMLQRIRNEQRWQQKVKNGEPSGEYRFTNRFRYLLSFSIPVFKNPKLPRLMVADEILLHAGKEVIFNTFDQNRFSIGIQQRINPSLSFDLAYMHLFQQKYNGFEYDVNHTLRWFFYYTPNWSKGRKHKEDGHRHLSGEE